MTDAPPVQLRAPEGTRELNFVRHSWTESQLKHRPSRIWFEDDGRPSRVERMDKGAFLAGHAKIVDRLVARSAVVAAAVSPGLLAGWLVYEPGLCIHYLYIDRTFRKLGVASLLLEQANGTPRVISHWTPAAEKLFRGYSYEPTRAWV